MNKDFVIPVGKVKSLYSLPFDSGQYRVNFSYDSAENASRKVPIVRMSIIDNYANVEISNFLVPTNKIFIGKNSPKSGSVLLVNPNIYIGDSLYEYKLQKADKILRFVSESYNNGVLYDYAVGKKYVYLMLEKVAVVKSFFDFSKEIYPQYYMLDFKESWTSFLGFRNPEIVKRKEELQQKSVPMIIYIPQRVKNIAARKKL
jgi:hypothetical protein